MIWSFEGFFPFIIEFASAFYFAICIILLFLDVPKTEEYLPYRKAKKCMTASYFILGCNLLAWLILTKGGTGSWDEGLNVYVKLSDFLFFYMGMFCWCLLLSGRSTVFHASTQEIECCRFRRCPVLDAPVGLFRCL